MTTETTPNTNAGHVIHSVTRHKIFKNLSDATERVMAADKLGIPWRIERVMVDLGFGNDSISSYETTLTVSDEWKMP